LDYSYLGAKISNISETCKIFKENAIVLAKDCEKSGAHAYDIKKYFVTLHTKRAKTGVASTKSELSVFGLHRLCQ